jgi:hypothetical protein
MRVVKKTDNKIWFGGYGDDPYVLVAQRGDEDKFLGGCFLVETEADLEKYNRLNEHFYMWLLIFFVFTELPNFLAPARLKLSQTPPEVVKA